MRLTLKQLKTEIESLEKKSHEHLLNLEKQQMENERRFKEMLINTNTSHAILMNSLRKQVKSLFLCVTLAGSLAVCACCEVFGHFFSN